ncbi:MAG: O-antigen ligase family protein [Flavobacteriales bacterium]|nr:O-antigen ligase family protein [Flavobacteriales bacterium]
MKPKGIALITLAFFAPISIFVTDVAVFSLAILWLFEGQFISKWNKIKSNPWLLSLMALLFLYVVGMLWGTNHQGAKWLFQKSAILILLPILYTLNFSQKEVKYSLFAFLSATTLSALIANLINLGWINHLFKYSSIFAKNWHYPAFMTYTDHNVFLAFSLLVTFFILFNNYSNKKLRIVLIFISTLYLLSLYTENGRSGQLAFILIFLSFSLLAFWYKKRVLIFSVIAILAINTSAYFLSPHFKKRIDSIRIELTQLEKNKVNSINTRYYLYKYSYEKIKEKPVLGYGTGSFVKEFSSISEHATKTLAGVHKTPHNNYLFIWFELGLIGLVVFLSIFFFQLKAYQSLNQGYFRMIFPAIFLVIMLTDTYFQNHNTAVLYCYLSFIFSTYSFE